MNGFVIGVLFFLFGLVMITLEVVDRKLQFQMDTAYGEVKTIFGRVIVVWERNGEIAILAYPKKSPNESVYFVLPPDSRTAFEVDMNE